MSDDPYRYGQRTDDFWPSPEDNGINVWPSTDDDPAGAWAPTEHTADLWPVADSADVTSSWSSAASSPGSDSWPPPGESAPDLWGPVEEPATASATPAEPFWRSESWLLEPLPDEPEPPGAPVGSAAPDYVDEDLSAYAPPAAEPAAEPAADSAAAPPPVGAEDPLEDYYSSKIPWDTPLTGGGEAVKWDDLYQEPATPWEGDGRDTETSLLDPIRRDAAEGVPTNASDFAAQRTATATEEPPTRGLPALLHKASAGHVRLRPTRDERRRRGAIADIRRSIGGLRQITFTNPKGGSGKTTAALLTSLTLGQLRGGYVLAWDNNETQGTLGVRARPDHHHNTVRDLVANLPSFSGPVPGRVGDLARFVRSQGDAMFDVLASDEQAEAGEMMTAAAFQAVREVVGRFYKIICVDTGNNVRAANWAASIDSTDQLVVTSSVRWESAYSASRMLDYLEQSGRGDLVANAVTVLVMPRSMKGLNLPQVETHFKVRTREVLYAPFDPQLDNGDEIRFKSLSEETRDAWLEISAAVARGL
ncbi:MAG: chromosome partitioning protein [Actinomycetota bacterium]|nr:chromosome partitioning protein [Actinomycetota bacterium]